MSEVYPPSEPGLLNRFDLNFCELFQLPLSLLFLQCLLPLHGFFFVLFPGFLHQVIARLLQDLPLDLAPQHESNNSQPILFILTVQFVLV